jgi:hypothetical protein
VIARHRGEHVDRGQRAIPGGEPEAVSCTVASAGSFRPDGPVAGLALAGPGSRPWFVRFFVVFSE